MHDALELEDGTLVCQPPRLQLSFENIDRHGCYALDTVDRLYLYVGRALSDRFCTNVLGVPNFAAIPEDMNELPQLETEESERVRNLLSWTQSRRPFYSPLRVISCTLQQNLRGQAYFHSSYEDDDARDVCVCVCVYYKTP
ncbi:protein transport protein Sec24A-like isoform X1 [Rhipicephalus microplus]|uniref:protein transport protein Sec24A-like isoform X1 n=1 Tax=Rhipicephalus microplus TaxID=6941 RepID=UPI003F6BAA80